jgi:aminocarboxymuconate-semialdehyde decarboxylase
VDLDEQRIDVHTHVVPPATPFLERLTASDHRWARLVRRVDRHDVSDVIVAGRVFRTIRRVAYDLEARQEEQAARGVAGQVLSAMPELFATWAPAADSADYCRAFNDWLAAEVDSRPGFYSGLGLVPMQDPAAAAAMLPAIRQLGLLGVEVPSSTPAAPLHDPRFREFFAEAERLGLLVFVHAVGAVDTFSHPMAGSSAVFPARIGEAIAGLIANGVLARHPGLRVLASHGGGSLPVSLARLDFFRGTTPALLECMPEPAAVYAARIWYDPLVFDAALLKLLAEIVGTDRVVLGSDYPFVPVDPNTALNDPRLGDDFRAQVNSRNPRRLLGLLGQAEAGNAPISGGNS